MLGNLCLLQFLEVSFIAFSVRFPTFGVGMGVNEFLGRYVPIDFAVAIFMIHCGENTAYNKASIEILRVARCLHDK